MRHKKISNFSHTKRYLNKIRTIRTLSKRALNALIKESFQERDLVEALEIGKELESRCLKRGNNGLLEMYRLLNSFIEDIMQWPIRQSQEVAIGRLSRWYSYQSSKFPIFGEHDRLKETTIRKIYGLEQGNRYHLKDEEFQVLKEISQKLENVLKVVEHPLFWHFKELFSFHYLPKFLLDEDSKTIEIRESPFFNELESFEKVMLKIKSKDDPLKNDDYRKFKGILFEENGTTGELILTEQGEKYHDHLLTTRLKVESHYTCFMEQKYAYYNDLLRLFVKLCLLPPRSVVVAKNLSCEDHDEVTPGDIKLFLYYLIEESANETSLFKSLDPDLPKNDHHIRHFINDLKNWNIPIPLLELVSQNTIKVKKNPWYSHFCPAFQHFLNLEDISDIPLKRLKRLSFRQQKEHQKYSYQYQQNKLYDFDVFPDISPEGRKFLDFIEKIFVVRLLRWSNQRIDILARGIDRKFMNSLKSKNNFLQIIGELKTVKINEHIEVRFLGGSTVIFIDGHEFVQCKYILLINPHLHERQDQINSIDEAQRYLSNELEREAVTVESILDRSDRLENSKLSALGISPEEEFWAHLSNLQAWVEHDYDTRLLHSNLSFPLLKALARSDPLAKMRLQEEIVSRVSARYFPVIAYLMEEQYYKYLTPEQLEYLIEVLKGIYSDSSNDLSSREVEHVETFIQAVNYYVSINDIFPKHFILK